MLIDSSPLNVRKESQDTKRVSGYPEVWGQAKEKYIDPVIGVAAELWTSATDTSTGHHGPASPNSRSGLHTEPQLHGPLLDKLKQRTLMGHLFLKQVVDML